MKTSIPDFLLSLLAQYGGGALNLVRKGWSAIRGLLGNVRALVRPLLKEAIAFLASKLKHGATVVRETTQKAGSKLLRVAERFMGKRRDTELEPEPETTAKREAETPKKADAPSHCAPGTSAAPQSATTAPAAAENLTRAAILVHREPKPPTVDTLATLGPVVGRALIRALSRPRPPRPLSTIRDLGLESAS